MTCVLETPCGHLRLEAADGYVTGVSWTEAPLAPPEDALLREAGKQLKAYFAGERTAFELPIRLKGTDFQLRVWNALREIPFGEVRSYAEIAERAGSPKGFRAAGMACHVNPVAVIVPCHRVVGRDGSLTGYAGGLEVKRFLLALEKQGRSQEQS